MELSAAIDVVTDRVRAALLEAAAPSLLPLPHLEVLADCIVDDRQVRIRGEALYALHRGERAEWAILVEESNLLPPGVIQFVDVADVRVGHHADHSV